MYKVYVYASKYHICWVIYTANFMVQLLINKLEWNEGIMELRDD